MQNLQKYVPEEAHVLFGAAIDPTMGDNLSITLISALPESSLTSGKEDRAKSISDGEGKEPPLTNPNHEKSQLETTKGHSIADHSDTEISQSKEKRAASKADEDVSEMSASGDLKESKGNKSKEAKELESSAAAKPSSKAKEREETQDEITADDETPEAEAEEAEKIRVDLADGDAPLAETKGEEVDADELAALANLDSADKGFEEKDKAEEPKPDEEGPALAAQKLDSKNSAGQSELSFESAPRGRFEGETPNEVDGEDLDLPPFLRKRK